MKEKKILVTGATGFIGSYLAKTLVEQGHWVTGVDNFLKADRERELGALENLELIELDLCEADLENRLGTEWDEAYHLAAVVGVERVCREPRLTIRNNVISTIRFLDWASRSVAGRVVFSSSAENYASFHGTGLLPLPTPEDVPIGLRDIYDPRWSYAASKILGEVAFAHWDLEFAIVRYHNVYGPAMHSRHVIPELFSEIWQGVNPLRVVSASHTRVFCHVRDAVAATIAAAQHAEAKNRVLNIGSPDAEINIGDLARRMVEVSGRDIEVEASTDIPGSVKRRRPDVSAIRALLGDHRYTNLDRGLEECWRWQEATGWIA